MHWDLRLEHEGTLASWAVPKGIPPDPKRNHLAVRTEDHPLEYLDFHGEIPAGSYGAGTMRICDRGTYELAQVARQRGDGHLPRRARCAGRYVLFRTGGKNWMIHRMDPPEDPDREPMPEQDRADAGAHRARSRARTAAGRTRSSGTACARSATRRAAGCGCVSRNGNDITPRYPELRELGRALGSHEAVLDGEVVAFGADGRAELPAPPEPHAPRLGERGAAAGAPRARRYVIFDLLFLDGHSLMALPYEERRERLLELGLNGPNWQTPAHHVGRRRGAAGGHAGAGAGGDHRQAPRLPVRPGPPRAGLGEGQERPPHRGRDRGLARRRGRPRRAARRARRRLPRRSRRRCATPAASARASTTAELDRLGRLLAARARPDSPFEGRQPPKLTHFVEPDLVASVDFSQWTQREHAAPALLQGPARRRPAGRGARARRRLVDASVTRRR